MPDPPWTIDPPYRLDPWQNIVNCSFGIGPWLILYCWWNTPWTTVGSPPTPVAEPTWGCQLPILAGNFNINGIDPNTGNPILPNVVALLDPENTDFQCFPPLPDGIFANDTPNSYMLNNCMAWISPTRDTQPLLHFYPGTEFPQWPYPAYDAYAVFNLGMLKSFAPSSLSAFGFETTQVGDSATDNPRTGGDPAAQGWSQIICATLWANGARPALVQELHPEPVSGLQLKKLQVGNQGQLQVTMSSEGNPLATPPFDFTTNLSSQLWWFPSFFGRGIGGETPYTWPYYAYPAVSPTFGTEPWFPTFLGSAVNGVQETDEPLAGIVGGTANVIGAFIFTDLGLPNWYVNGIIAVDLTSLFFITGPGDAAGDDWPGAGFATARDVFGA
jgi:hypothetical protein